METLSQKLNESLSSSSLQKTLGLYPLKKYIKVCYVAISHIFFL